MKYILAIALVGMSITSAWLTIDYSLDALDALRHQDLLLALQAVPKIMIINTIGALLIGVAKAFGVE